MVGSDYGSGGSKGISSGGTRILSKLKIFLSPFGLVVFTWTGPGFYIVVLSWRSILAVTAGQTPLTI